MAVDILFEWGEKLDCQSCDEKLKEERGHTKEGIIPFLVNKERIKRCPLTVITPLSYEYIRAFSFYEKSILPNGEGTNQESNKYLQAMLVLTNSYNKLMNKQNNQKSK